MEAEQRASPDPKDAFVAYDEDGSTPEHKPGDVVNGHILTAAGWLPLRRVPPGSPGPYYAGDMLDANAYTGTGWVHVPFEEAAKVPLSHVARPFAPLPVPPPRKRTSGLTWLLVSAIGLAFLVGLGVLGSHFGKSNQKVASAAPLATPTVSPQNIAPTPVPTVVPDPMVKYAARMKKRGWTQMADSLWAKFDGSEADGFAATWKVRVVSPTGCPYGVYMEANVLDASNTVVGYTNAVLPSLAANQQAILQLTSTATGRIQPHFTKVTCN